MRIVWEVGLQAVEILTLVVGMLGMAMSVLLLVTPAAAHYISGLVNRGVDIEKKLKFLDKDLRTEEWIYSHGRIAGSLLALASLFAFTFFLFNVNVSELNRILFGDPDSTGGQILLLTFVWIGRLACVMGVLIGVGLAAAPNALRRLERGLNVWIDTRSWIEAINRPTRQLDTVIFRFPVFFGILGGAVSALLIVLSVLNLLN